MHNAPDPIAPAPFVPQMRRYQDWLARERGLRFDSYDALWRWSVTDLNGFWQSVWDYLELSSPTPHSAALARNVMPGAVWFAGAQINYAQQVLRHVQPAHAAGFAAVIADNERGQRRELSWPELRRQVASLALHLQAQGVQPGERVAAYLPNIPETMVAFLAVVSIGAVWSVCAPDMGTPAVLDRFKQIEPVVLIACDGVTYGGKDHDRLAVVAELRAALPSLRHVLLHVHLAQDPAGVDRAMEAAQPCAAFSTAAARDDAAVATFEPLWLPFDHPLWIVYSSGTTGLPKPIVHGHGGIVLVMRAMGALHNDLGCSYHPNSWGERYHWYSSTGWVMWNAQVAGLLGGTTCVIYDGNPGGSKEHPDWTVLWRLAAREGVTFFGAGAAFYANCMKAGVDLSTCGDLSKVRALGTTGSPLSEDAQHWGTDQFRRLREAAQHVGESDPAAGPPPGGVSPLGGQRPAPAAQRGGESDPAAGPPQGGVSPLGGQRPAAAAQRGGDIWWCNISGGTDFAGAFIGGHRDLPQTPGRMQCRQLGAAVEAWDEQGRPVIDAVGELVCTQPIPSMPLYFVGDADHRRLIGSYFDMFPPGHGRRPGPPRSPAARGPLPPEGAVPALGRPGDRDLGPEAGAVWRHGDWLRIFPDGSCVIYGRSDATINRHGLRMGTSELYSAVEALPEVLDSLVVDLEYLGRESHMPLFVVLRPGLTLDDAMTAKITGAIRTALSPRFVPDAILQVAEIPRTLSGKKQELPIKKLLLGQPLEKVINREAMANPGCLDWYVAYAAEHLARHPASA